MVTPIAARTNQPRASLSSAAPSLLRSTRTPAEVGLLLYQSLRERGSSAPGEIAAHLGLSLTDAARWWQKLQELGLVRSAQTAGDVDPVDPDTAALGLFELQRVRMLAQSEELDQLRQTADTLIQVFRPVVVRESVEVQVEVLRDQRRRRRYLNSLNDDVMTQTCSMHPGPLPAATVLAASLEEDARMVQRGLRVGAIYGQSVATAPWHRRYLADLVALGAEVRLVPQVPFDLLIFDSHTAMLPSDPTEPSRTILAIRGAQLLPSYVALFEDVWLRSVPLTAAGDEAVNALDSLADQQRTVMRLLGHGHTDELIGKRLGNAARTVGRIVALVMQEMKATSRFQAGMLAASSGLMDSAS
ncbi:LuxR C-terminal-related transcriptional regulator [Streptomyces sp. H10-C2]|uniref:LuxR C-terminal-related transcriptional regulator n=1 Tax=unclassified Streptomyces TaxID=2593676 RepID=UPI0024B88641|nr:MULTISPECIES: LuxR C-terminal-related transcriptional regulator [unclassified Streptomyces]MDJ0344814.1 LuxR C-terminal-related transcriptional regulator [Streptomyces sp. PH10-H1]MDJ0369699.1 LuxR C-terminal-related transcriptional regulator [Streptomyces sp. H10-C2]